MKKLNDFMDTLTIFVLNCAIGALIALLPIWALVYIVTSINGMLK